MNGSARHQAEERSVVTSAMDGAWYLRRHPDVAAAGIPAVEHFCGAGWREGRDPAPWFQTAWYLTANPDIRAADINPFWHFLVQGRAEGRLPAQPAGPPRAARAPQHPMPAETPPATLPPGRLAACLGRALLGVQGCVLALSHDRYTQERGGTQLLVALEQYRFNGDGAAYVHLSPFQARLGLAPRADRPILLNVILNGRFLGVCTDLALRDALGRIETPQRLLVLHNLHGLAPEAVLALATALRPQRSVYWAHDFGALCENPRLMRNDVAFCAAPPPDSMACRVCVYGSARADHLERTRRLFEALRPMVVAPSPTALTLWRRGGFAVSDAVVHPHGVLRPTASPLPRGRSERIVVAFVGQPGSHKGWHVFRTLLAAARHRDTFRFLHFAGARDHAVAPGLELVAAETTPEDPHGMARSLAAHAVDLVLALSPWPETFGYVAHEALAAGADVVTTEASGHVAAMVRETGRGVVLAGPSSVPDWFLRGAAARHVAGRRAAPAPPLAFRHLGSTATLGRVPGDAAATEDPALHLLLCGGRIDGTRHGPIWRFALPPGGLGRVARLRSRFCRPAWDGVNPGDPRRLGVAVQSVALDGQVDPAGSVRRRRGWHAPEPGWQWTDGDAALSVGAARRLELVLAPVGQWWRAPLLR